MRKRIGEKYLYILSCSIIYFGLSFILPSCAEELEVILSETYGWMDEDCAYSVTIDSQGYYVIVGHIWSNTTGEDLLILKMDPINGNIVWSKMYTTGGHFFQRAYAVTVDSEGYYIVVGQYDDPSLIGIWDFWILKVDPVDGDTLWSKSYGGNKTDWATSVVIDLKGYYVVTGYHQVAGGPCCWVLKMDPADGDTIWAREYWDGSPAEIGSSVAIDLQGYYVITGVTWNSGADSWDCFILKLNPINGDTLWTKIYGGVETYDGWAVGIDSQGYYVVAGHTGIPGEHYDVWVLKIDPMSGDTLWARTYGGPFGEYGLSLVINSQGDYLVAGMTQSFDMGDYDIWLLKIDPVNGDTLWTKTYGGMSYDRANSIAVDSQGYYIIAGETESFGAGNIDCWILKLDGTSIGISEDETLPGF